MNSDDRLNLAFSSLKGTSIGDAFGESFFGDTGLALQHIDQRTVPKTQWEFTDDTIMSVAVYKQLRNNGAIKQDELAKEFARLHELDPNRGYGASARSIFREIANGEHWKKLSGSAFEGMGSMGNGASMRVASIGAYFFDDLDLVVENAIRSAEVTHMNEEAVAGAIAVAIAAALATNVFLNRLSFDATDFLKRVLEYVPQSDTRSKINKALHLPYSYNIDTVKSALGDGTKILAQDTVPISLWCVAHNIDNFESALWKAVSVLGDRDTICAIVAGIVILSAKRNTVPAKWAKEVEQVQSSVFYI